MKLEVILSCMNCNAFSIIESSNLSEVNTLLVNQCNENNNFFLDEKHRIINTNTRGLSVSRNIGLKNTKGDICLIADDDEYFIDGIEKIIINAYLTIEDADIIIFKVKNWPDKFGGKQKQLSRLDLLKVSSVQISFRRTSVVGKIDFDPCLGAGTPNGAGEENKFLLECLKKRLKIYYVPVSILLLDESKSTWFKGYDKDYFYKRGYTTRYIYGLSFAVIYALYFVLTKKRLYKNYMSFPNALFYLMQGIKDNCLCTKKREE